MYLEVSAKSDEERDNWTLQSAIQRIANSKHGDANWMRSVARQALAQLTVARIIPDDELKAG